MKSLDLVLFQNWLGKFEASMLYVHILSPRYEPLRGHDFLKIEPLAHSSTPLGCAVTVAAPTIETAAATAVS